MELPTTMSASKPTVFISYSHKDEVWKNKLRPHLEVLAQQNRIRIWDDRHIDPGGKWREEISDVMANAAVALCLISADYLASDFCIKEEVPVLLERSGRDGMMFIPILLRRCAWKAVPWLKERQLFPRDGKSVAKDYRDDWDDVFADVAEHIFDILDNPNYMPPQPPPPAWPVPEKIDIDRLPVTGAELFGRTKELALLDDCWDSDTTHIVSLVAWGGVGKSTLVNKWLERMAADNYRGARRVYAWSFHSQGSGERVSSADLFIHEALTWFGDPEPGQGSPWDKGQRLAERIQDQPTLLLLDGIEPLQSGHDFERGKIKDPALATLLTELARHNPGLCLITSRETLADFKAFPEQCREQDLEQISAAAGRALLRVGGVRGSDEDLEAATAAFGHHALALRLLASYLREQPSHHIEDAEQIPDLDIPDETGKHPRRLLAAFGRYLGDGPTLQLLRLLGLFDRPAEREALAALCASPPIPDLTEQLQDCSEGQWLRLVAELRRLGLIAPEGRHRSEALDTHPLVREHFAAQLQAQNPEAWREANGRLYEYYRDSAEEYPDTLEAMAPLYTAVVHGCTAGRYQEALDEVFWRRINSEGEFYNMRKLGAFGVDLAALTGFFIEPWRYPVVGLSEAAQAFVLGNAGFRLRAMGRLAEAEEPMGAALEAQITQEDWKNAATSAGNLSELQLTLGHLGKAVDFAEQSVALADQSGDAFQRMVNRSTLADALHQEGRFDEAEALFREAEAMQQERQPDYPLLYSFKGYQYCDLLLGRGQYENVLERAEQTIEIAQRDSWLLDIALDHLSLGRAHLLQPQAQGTKHFTEATCHLIQAVAGLRQAGTQDHLPRGLLARAALHRLQCDYNHAQHDIDEALTIASRGQMALHQADAHLEQTRLYLAMKNPVQAYLSLRLARAIIEETGYHRRDNELAELTQMLSDERKPTGDDHDDTRDNAQTQ